MFNRKKRQEEIARKEKSILYDMAFQLRTRYKEAMRVINQVWKNKKIAREIINCAKKNNISLSRYKEIEIGSYCIRFNFTSFGMLKHTRKLLKLMIPNYKDNLSTIYVPYSNDVWIDYSVENKGYKNIEIRFHTTVETIPKMYLRGGKCGFETVIEEAQEESESIKFACNL